MRKNVFGRRLRRDTNERKALFKSLVSSLVLYGKIQTTHAKAKSIKGHIDKLVNTAKKKGTNVSDLLRLYLSAGAVRKLVSLAPRLDKRTSGYTRFVRVGNRISDDASMVMMEWVDLDQVQNFESQIKKLESKKEKKEHTVPIVQKEKQTKEKTQPSVSKKTKGSTGRKEPIARKKKEDK